MLFKFFDISSLEYKFLVNSTAKLAIKTESPKLSPIFFPRKFLQSFPLHNHIIIWYSHCFLYFLRYLFFFVKKHLCKAIYSLLSIKTINFAAEKLYSGRKLAQNRGIRLRGGAPFV